jgi:hypothetical protein
MPVTFIGDVHGWSDRLERVLDLSAGLIVFVGDLIDRGPDSPGVLERVRRLTEAGKAACIMGNHEYALVRGLGVPELGIPAQPALFQAWAERYGGKAVLEAYGVRASEPDRLRARLGQCLPWMARLPWVLEGSEGAASWIAVHAGLSRRSFRPQVESLRVAQASLRDPFGELPPALYAKPRAFMLPDDLPITHCVVSGHTPMDEVYLRPQRILCDTSGGMPDSALSGVIWPSRTVIAS